MPDVVMRGQAIVEFAVVLPLLMFVLLGFAELAITFANRQGYQNGVDVLAAWAASEMAEKPNAEDWRAGWGRVVNEEAERTGCDDADGPEVILPDDTHGPGDRVLIRWECSYKPSLTADLGIVMPIRVESAAVVPGAPARVPSPS